MDLKVGLSLMCMAVLMINSTIGEAARKHGRRATHQNSVASSTQRAKPYGAGLNEEQSLRALEAEISRKLGSHVQEGDYPEQARREGWSGTTWVDVRVDSNGKIKEVSVQQSSGFTVLDEQAMRMVDRISLWWIPQRLRNREVMVAVPVGFYIREAPGRSPISADALSRFLADRMYLPTPHCRDSDEINSGFTPSSAHELVPVLRPVQDSTVSGWTAAHALR